MKRQHSTTRAVLVHTDLAYEHVREPYDLATAASLADTHPERIIHYCHLGLISGSPDPKTEKRPFTDQSVFELRRIEFLRREAGVNLTGIRLIIDLLRHNESLREALRFHSD